MSIKCKITACDKPARWTIETKGHPNGDIETAYCREHLFPFAWDESPTPYTITIRGPFDPAALAKEITR